VIFQSAKQTVLKQSALEQSVTKQVKRACVVIFSAITLLCAACTDSTGERSDSADGSHSAEGSYLAEGSYSAKGSAESADTRPSQFFGAFSQETENVYMPVTKARPMTLPEDHKSHPEFQLEWWYLTFVLEDEENNEYGLQYTLFRFSNAADSMVKTAWSEPQQWMGHASLHSKTEHYFEERLAAGGVGNAFVKTSPFSAVIDNWSWTSEGASPFPAALAFSINQEVDVALSLSTYGPFIKQGESGYSKKTQNEQLRSYYYSQPFIDANGTVTINNQSFSVKGLGWYDHEWTSHLANDSAMGWDWFSLHLNDGSKLMAFRMHSLDDSQIANNTASDTRRTQNEIYTTGTYITKTGKAKTLQQNDIHIRPLKRERIVTEKASDKNNTKHEAEHSVPTSWEISIPSKKLKVNVAAFKTGQWNHSLFPYYEGRVSISGTHDGKGFMELTGY
jgi:predicted secreted hydrolase